MKHHFYAIAMLVLFISCTTQEEKWDGETILNNSRLYHDPDNQWNGLEFYIHIQEPRLLNPSRYSKVKLNNSDGRFELLRNRGHHISKHTIDSTGNAKVYVDNSEAIADTLVEKYGLSPERNKGYRDFYKMMYGLPMTLDKEMVSTIGAVERMSYNNEECYKIPLILKEEMFSKHWIIYIATSNNAFKGMEIIFPDDETKGERLYFEGELQIKNVKIPRIRHWYTYAKGTYSGSDIVLKVL